MKNYSNITPRFCFVDTKYLNYLRNFDYKVSLKDNRKFLVLAIKINKLIYAIPLSSVIKHRTNSVTVKIYNDKKVISNLLLNNMIQVYEYMLTDFIIDPSKDTYEALEEHYIRKNYQSICIIILKEIIQII